MLTSGRGMRWLHGDDGILRRISWRIMAYEGGYHHLAVTRHAPPRLSSSNPFG